MPDVSDMDLLRDYQRQGSEEAFAELVRRHVNLVYSAALRHAGIAAHAEEITQAVFVILARKAAGLRPDTILDAWLYETTRWTALSFLRGERRRQLREQEAYMQSELDAQAGSTWNQLSPLLDEAMLRLGQTDRDALVLRFFEGRSLNEVGHALGASEEAAKKRVNRALDKLRNIFAKRGVSSTTAIIAGAISAHSVQAAPVALAKAATAAAITKGAAASGSTLTLIKGALKIMAWTKAKTAIVTGAILVAAVGTTTITLNEFAFRKPASHPDASSPGGLNETNPVEYYILHTPLLQNNEQLRSDLIGTWKLTGAKSLKTGKFVVLAPENRFYKTFTLTDWSTVSYDSNSNLLNSAGGPYTINGELCKETIATATGEKSQFLGARVPFRIRVIGDDYYQMGSGSHPSVEQQWHRIRD
jgi:RNA polymerase sigma factor (sigma-70 family)